MSSGCGPDGCENRRVRSCWAHRVSKVERRERVPKHRKVRSIWCNVWSLVEIATLFPPTDRAHPASFILPSVAIRGSYLPTPLPHIRACDVPRQTAMKCDLDHCDRISLARRTNRLPDCGTRADRSTTVRTLSEYSACMLCIGRPSAGLFSVRVAQRNCKIQHKPYPSPNSTQCDLDWRASCIIVNLKVIRSVS